VVGVATPAGWPATLPPSSSSLLDASRQSLGIISSRFLAHGACWILAPKSVMAWLLASAVAGAATLSSDSDAGLLCFPPS
jgi:hypothetical protein